MYDFLTVYIMCMIFDGGAFDLPCITLQAMELDQTAELAVNLHRMNESAFGSSFQL